MLAHECLTRNPRQTCDKQPFCDCDQCVEKIVQEAMDYLIRPTQQQQQQQQQGDTQKPRNSIFIFY